VYQNGRAASAAAPPSSVMNARRFTASASRASDVKDSTALLRCGISIWAMSAVGHQRPRRSKLNNRACRQDRVLRNLTCKRIQVDEIWAFVYAKQKNIAGAKKAPPNAGDVWAWTAIDADTKLIPSWFVGGRDSDAAIIFMDDLKSRLANFTRLTNAFSKKVEKHAHSVALFAMYYISFASIRRYGPRQRWPPT
jgi:IS1 family transposase